MLVIFLDIDGVLNLRNRTRDRFGPLFHKRWQDNLNHLVEETGSKIVISSSWRSDGLDVMQKMWQKRKMAGEVIDRTPFFHNPNYDIPRGIEIDWWLKKIGKFQRINWSKEHQIKWLEDSLVKNYIIIDDDSDMLYGQKEHFIHTSHQWDCKDAIEGKGLTKKATESAIKVLKSNIVELYYP